MFKGIMAVLVMGFLLSFSSCSDDEIVKAPKNEYVGEWVNEIDATNRNELTLTEDKFEFKAKEKHEVYRTWLAKFKVYGTLTSSFDDLFIVLTSIDVPNDSQTGYNKISADDATWEATLTYLGFVESFAAKYSVTDNELMLTVGGDSEVYQMK